jgi:hypothetical protein
MHITIGLRTILARTCTRCGEFKQADEFARVMGGYCDSYCKDCHNAHSKPVMLAHQKEALRAATKHRQPWTDGECRRLAEMVSEGRTGPYMAKELNRSVYAVYTMKARLLKES